MITLVLFLSCGRRPVTQSPVSQVQFPYHPLQTEKDLNVLISEIGDAKLVLLGESSHGSAEFYEWRAAISKRLITEKGFDFIAVEGDWVDMINLNEFISGKREESVQQVMSHFNRWPQWLWANKEFAEFCTWLQQHQPVNEKPIGVYGLDVFAFSKGLAGLKSFFPDTTPLHAAATCFNQHSNDAIEYSAYVKKSKTDCRLYAEAIWKQALQITGGKIRNEKDLLILQQAALIKNGEAYFRTRNYDPAVSWNGRVMHMHETIKRLLEYYGRDAKGIIWAHNTHVGDAHYTDMPSRKRTNIGETLRNEFGEKNIYIIGFGSYTGEVLAGEYWGAEAKRMRLRVAKEGTWEEMLHRDGHLPGPLDPPGASAEQLRADAKGYGRRCQRSRKGGNDIQGVNKILFSKDLKDIPSLRSWVPQRATGVVHTETYIPSIIHRRYDAFVFFDSTRAVSGF
jgi:erythromycin esterase